ncbi:PEP-CTERM sorting domain-containing protein [Luteolibacter marinus]|uniref:PEP-CTERM sorting domain-containing protein n=1 Tax=Luteolibacter marinus TaxID=2776705 RepID=UPI001867BC46|nr:PEP-CTERM sorting domain-containing protein [Luteolibacter marinus]
MNTIPRLLLGGLVLAAATSQAATLSLNGTSFEAGSGAAITASFSNHTGGSATDWFGLYPQGEVPDGNPPATAWDYVDGTQSSGSLDVGSFSRGGGFTLNNAYLGNWTVHFLANDTYGAVAGTAGGWNFTVTPAAGISLVPGKSEYQIGETINLAWAGNAGWVSTDWIGIYQAGELPGSEPSVVYQYTTGTGGNLDFAALAPGQYDAYLLANDGYTPISQTSFAVVPEPSLAALGLLGLGLVSFRRNR